MSMEDDLDMVRGKGEVPRSSDADAGLEARLLKPGLVSLVALGLASCGGGGGGAEGAESSTPTNIAPRLAASSSTTISAADAARFLLQTQFTATDAEIASVQSLGFTGWLDSQFAQGQGQSGWEWLDSIGKGVPDASTNYFDTKIIDSMIWNQLLSGGDQVRKRFALALSEVFVVCATSFEGYWPAYMAAGYWDLLVSNAFGNFRSLLEAITLNPAMGFCLNTRGNLKEDNATGRQPDENFAREIMQLFTIGLYELNLDGTPVLDSAGRPKETYGQADVSNLARVFTGYDYDMSRSTMTLVPVKNFKIPLADFTRRPMALNPNNHSFLPVNFLRTSIPQNTSGPVALKTALDALFNHPNVGPFFAKQMIKRLVTSNPSPAYVARVAQIFNSNGAGVRGDLKSVWKAILTDPEALTRPSSATAGKLREPIVRCVQWGRTMNVSSKSRLWPLYFLSPYMTSLGQHPLRSPSVFNFFRPGYVPPQTGLAASQLTAPEFQIHNEASTADYINFMTNAIRYGLNNDILPDYGYLVSISTDATKLVDWLNLHLTANQLSANTLKLITNSLNATALTATSSTDAKIDRVCAATLMVMVCPEYLIQK